MKKKSLILITAVTLLVALLLPVFASCGETNEPPKDPTYKITATSTADYAITASATSAKAGDNIEVTVSVLNDDKYLTKVLYNGKNCYFSNGKYSFDMPSEDVTITAELATYTEVLKDGIASFDLGNITSLKKTEYEDFAELEVDLNTSYMTNCITEFTSSNQKVIPDNAISFRARYQSQSNIIIGGYVQIDTSKISNGTTWLTMKFKNGNVSGASNSGELVVKITVAEDVVLETWQQTLVFDVSDVHKEGNTYKVLLDRDTLSSDDDIELTGLTADENGKITVKVDLVQYKDYNIHFDIEGEPVQWYKLADSIGSGSSVTGFNQCEGGVLHFINAGVTLEIPVLSK